MSSLPRLMRAGARTAGVVAGATGATVAGPTVSARAPAMAPAQGQATQKLVEDEWSLLSADGEEVLLFKPWSPEEIEDCASQVQQLLFPAPRRPTVRIEEENENGGPSRCSESTDGGEATSVITAAMLGPNPFDEETSDLLRITSKLLSRPGLQREVISCMLEDEEVRGLMLRQTNNLDAYLSAVGFHSPGLLPPAAMAAIAEVPEGAQAKEWAEGDESSEDDVVGKVIKAIATGLEKAGNAFSMLGGWLRDRFTDFQGRQESQAEEQAQQGEPSAADASGRPRRNGRTADAVLGSVMVVAFALVCMLIIRRPLTTLSVPRRA